MFKLILLLFGVALGAGGTTAWLLSEPGVGAPPAGSLGGSLQERLKELTDRFNAAKAEGERVGGETEQRLRRELDVYRSGNRPAAA